MRVASLVLLLCSAAFSSDTTLHYTLQVKLEPAAHRMAVEAEIVNPPHAEFYLHRSLEVKEIVADGKPVDFHVDAKAAPLAYAQESRLVVVEAKSPKKLKVKYEGAISDVVWNVNLISADLTELAMYASWYPLFGVGQRLTYELSVEAPAPMLVVTNGELKMIQAMAGLKRSEWRSFGEATDIVLIASPLLKRAESGKAEVYFDKLPETDARALAEKMGSAMKRATAWLGEPAVADAVRIVYSPRDGWGYSRVPLIVVSEKRMSEASPAAQFRANAHELAHFWWMIADAATPDDWLNEGFAEYTAFRLASEYYGNDFAEKRVKRYRENVANAKTRTAIAETAGDSPDREVNRYDKATLMLLEAEKRFGREKLDGLMRVLAGRYSRTHDATTAMFLREAEKEMGKAAAEFFRQELYRK